MASHNFILWYQKTCNQQDSGVTTLFISPLFHFLLLFLLNRRNMNQKKQYWAFTRSQDNQRGKQKDIPDPIAGDHLYD